jgi:hypothetical protein
MKTSHLAGAIRILLGLVTLSVASLATAEPPSRAARLAEVGGTVSFSPAGESDWAQAEINQPLTTGDRVWADAGSRAELQLGGAAMRLGAATSLTVLNLDDRIAQLQLSQGTLKVHVHLLAPGQSFEVDTPNLALTVRRPGDYRLDVDPDSDATTVTVQGGEAEVWGDDASYTVTSRQGYRFYGTGLSDYDTLAARPDDELDRWARERDRRTDDSPSARFVSPEVVGYEDLDANGSWSKDPSYGNVWTPNRVPAGWTPYRDGHWTWVDPWGWTWVDAAAWGFAVSHYGRWASIRGAWGWVPGPAREQAVYAPALVAFVGGKDFQISVAAGATAAARVGWFPLAPREVYQPSYPVSRGYFDNINRSNAVIAPTTITNVYNTTTINKVNVTNQVVNVVYANQQISGAVIAVPARAFVESLSVAKAAVPMSREAAMAAPVAHVAAVVPVAQSLHGGGKDASAKPPQREHVVVARTAPPPAPVPFAAQLSQLAARPGTPMGAAQRLQLKPATPAQPARVITVVTPAHVAAATAAPPATAPAARSPEARRAAAAIPAALRPPVRVVPPVPAVVERKPDEAARIPNVNKPEATKAAAATAAAAEAQAAEAQAAKAQATKAAGAKADAARAEAERTDKSKVDAARAASARSEAADSVRTSSLVMPTTRRALQRRACRGLRPAVEAARTVW